MQKALLNTVYRFLEANNTLYQSASTNQTQGFVSALLVERNELLNALIALVALVDASQSDDANARYGA